MFGRLFRQDTAQLEKLADQISGEVSSRIANKMVDEFAAIAEVEQAQDKLVTLQKQLAELRAEKANVEENFRRQEREVEHKVGLLRIEMESQEKQRQGDFDLRVKEARLAARETGLQEREKAFTERMDFITKRFESEVSYLKEIFKDISQRLPDASILSTNAQNATVIKT